MKLHKVIAAYKSLYIIMEMCLPYKVSRQVLSLHYALESEVEFYVSEENKLIQKYGKKENGKVVIVDDKVHFDSLEQMQAYISKISELKELEIEFDLPVINIKESDVENQKMRATDIENLSEFIKIGE